MKWVTFGICLIACAMVLNGCLSPEDAKIISGAGGAVSNSIIPGTGSFVDALIYAGLGYLGLRAGEAGTKYALKKDREQSGG